MAAVLGRRPHRPDRVDHPARGKQPGRRGDRLPGRQPLAQVPGPQRAARREDLRAAAPVDGAVDPAAAEQGGVRGVDDGVHDALGDVAGLQGDPWRHAASVPQWPTTPTPGATGGPQGALPVRPPGAARLGARATGTTTSRSTADGTSCAGSAPTRSRSPHPTQSDAGIERWAGRRDDPYGLWAVVPHEVGRPVGSVLLVPAPGRRRERGRRRSRSAGTSTPTTGATATPPSRRGCCSSRAGRPDSGEVWAVVHHGNDRSVAVTERLGMEPMGVTDRWYGVELDSFRLARPHQGP